MWSTPLRRSLTGLIAVATVATAWATVVQRVGIEELTRECAMAIDGSVREIRTVLDDESGAIWTECVLDVSETLVGEHSARVTVSIPGGQVGELVQDVIGMAQLEAGERAVLFLWRENDRLLVLGQSQGCLHVVRDPDTRELVCRNSLAGLTLVDARGAKTKATPIRLTLDALRTRVKDVRKAVAAERAEREQALARRLGKLRKAALERAELLGDRPGAGE